jgi:hypothetical protein
LAIIVFINLIIQNFKKDDLDEISLENSMPESAPKQLKGKKPTITIIFSTLKNIVVPIAFLALFIFWNLLNFIPSTINNFFPPDSYQNISITNNDKDVQTISVLGRLSYSNVWIPIIPSSPLIQKTPILKLSPNQKEKIQIRTGVNDIDHIIVTNLTNKKYQNEIEGIVLSVPRNEIVVYSNVMDTLSLKPDIFILPFVTNVVLNFAGIIGCICLFFKFHFSNKSQENTTKLRLILRPIISGIILAMPAVCCGFAMWWNIAGLLKFF